MQARITVGPLPLWGDPPGDPFLCLAWAVQGPALGIQGQSRGDKGDSPSLSYVSLPAC